MTHGSGKVGNLRDVLWLVGAIVVPMPWVLAALQVACPGTQNLDVDLAGFRARFEREFGAPL